MNLLNGSDFLIYIDTVTPITALNGNYDNYRAVVCGTSNGFNLDIESISTRNKCDGNYDNSESGYKSWNFDLDGYAIGLKMQGKNIKANFQEIADLALSGAKFWAKQEDIETSITREGVVRVGSFKETANLDSPYSFTCSFVGQGKPIMLSNLNTGGIIASFGYRTNNPFGDEINLVPQFSKKIADKVSVIPFNFTQKSTSNYLFIIIPHGQNIFNYWENNEFNFGDIPDYVWRSPITIGEYDYYLTRELQYITSTTPVITLKYNRLAPTSFSFTGSNSVDPLSINISNTVVMNGIDGRLSISVINSEMSINGAAYTNISGTIANGDTLTIKQIAPSSYSSNGVATIQVGSFVTGYNVSTRSARLVKVDYTVDVSRNPFVYMGYIPMRNGVEVSRFFGQNSGSIENVYYEGDQIGFRQVSFPNNSPWVIGTGASLEIKKEGINIFKNTIYNQVTELQNPNYTIPANTTLYNVKMLGIISGITGYVTNTLNLQNSGEQGDFEVNISDTTSGEFYLDIKCNPGALFSDINMLSNSNKITVSIINTENIGRVYTVEGISGFSQTVSVGSGLNNSINNVPKGSITITKNV